METLTTRPRFAGVLALAAASALMLAVPLDSAQDRSAYQQQLRPQFHFSPAASFTNDPNGLVYYKGRYHLFYQQRVYVGPAGLSCCDWGHAVSRDLVHWEQRPVAISRIPASAGTPGEAIYSGSAVVDWSNTSGFGAAANPPLVAIYTAARPGSQTQKLAYSIDDGDTWRVYAGNPVLDIQSGTFRDPKVFWYAPRKQWTMVVYSMTGTRFYTSPDLKVWTYQSTFGTGFECPDFFPLAIDGDSARQKWVLFEANGTYSLGDFDGIKFTADDPATTGRMDYGPNYYAAQTFSDTPGRRILISWISPGFARNGIWSELPWMGAMTVARELSLKTIDGKSQLVSNPVAEVAALRSAPLSLPSRDVASGETFALPAVAQDNQLEMELTLDPLAAAESGIRVLVGQGLFTTIGYDARTNEIYIDRTHSGRQDGLGGRGTTGRVALPAQTKGKPISLRVLVDQSTLEVYADGGSRVLSANVLPLVNTSLTEAANPGDTVLKVKGTTGFTAGQILRVNADANGPRANMREYKIKSVGDGLTLSSPLDEALPNGAPVSTAPATGVELFASGGAARFLSVRLWHMRSIWP